jgi:hypothetical protein
VNLSKCAAEDDEDGSVHLDRIASDRCYRHSNNLSAGYSYDGHTDDVTENNVTEGAAPVITLLYRSNV